MSTNVMGMGYISNNCNNDDNNNSNYIHFGLDLKSLK